MGTFSFWHWLIVLVVILIVFGAGKLPRVAGDLAAGIRNFKRGLQDPDKGGDASLTPLADTRDETSRDMARAKDNQQQGQNSS